MKIERMYVDQPDTWEEVSEEEFIRRTEWAGYWKKGTALQTLKDAGQLRTPWAFYRIEKQPPALQPFLIATRAERAASMGSMPPMVSWPAPH